MKHLLTLLYILQSILRVLTQCTVPASEFHLDGDYLIGGLFDIHQVHANIYHERPESIDCSSEPFNRPSYRRFQLMRFSVEEINNSTNLLPNVSLGYEIFDHCSEKLNFPGIFNLLSANGSIQAWYEPHKNLPKVIALVGPYSTADTMTVTPLLMMDLIPVVGYGAASSALSAKVKYPSFLRTVYPNKNIIEVIVKIILHFNWRWVAFLKSDNDYGKDGHEKFMGMIKDTEVCLAYSNYLKDDTNYSRIFKQIEAYKIPVIVAFALKGDAEALIDSAMQLNITNKVWIATDTWSLNKRLSKEKGIKNIGTVLGVSQREVKIPGFSDFIHSSKSQTLCGNAGQEKFCNQDCNCSGLNPDDIIAEDPSFSFPIYSAVYAIANALHNILQCGAGTCNNNMTVQPHTVLEELKKSNFTLLNQSIHFDNNGDPKFGSYSVVFWNHNGVIEEVGFYKFNPSAHFFINSTQIHWHKHGEVPVSQCSPECDVGHQRKPDGNQKCCFHCEICPDGTYINITEDPYTCFTCKETEWSSKGSTSCSLRVVEYISFTDSGAVLIMIGACVFVSLTLATSALFAINYNTPIVKSAGGPMCFLILGCLSLCALSVFCYIDQPTVSFCILRFSLFLLFYTVCLACFVVRSFEIVFIFKIAAKLPKLHSWWKNYHGHWVVITGAFVIQALLLLFGFSFEPPRPYSETLAYRDKIILGCEYSLKASSGPVTLLLSLCSLSFIFSYMGKDLPKNYNEAKSITFCLFLLILTWIIFATEYMLYHGKHIITHNALAVLSSLYSFLFWYFLPKCYIIIFQPYKNTQQYFQGLIQNYTKTISQ